MRSNAEKLLMMGLPDEYPVQSQLDKEVQQGAPQLTPFSQACRDLPVRQVGMMEERVEHPLHEMASPCGWVRVGEGGGATESSERWQP